MFSLNRKVLWSNKDLSEFEKPIFIHSLLFQKVTLYLHDSRDDHSSDVWAGQIHTAHSILQSVYVAIPNTKPALLTAQ